MPGIKELSGTELQNFLASKAQTIRDNVARAEELLNDSRRLEDEIFKPLNIDPKTFGNGKPTAKSGGKAKARNGKHERAGKGELRDAILDMIDKSPTKSITSAQANDLFIRKDYQTSAYVVLSRMEKLNVLKSEKGEGRGSIWKRK